VIAALRGFGNALGSRGRLRAVLVVAIGFACAGVPGDGPGWATTVAPIGAARAADAQRTEKVYRVGFVSPTAPGPRDDAFLRELRRLGYVDGRNVRIEKRFADGRPERIPALVDELVRLPVDVLVVGATVGARAARQATTTIPVVFAGSSDPVAGGIVTNLARPEGNLTGTSLAVGERFAGKWLELLKEAAPHVARVAVLWSASNPAAARFVAELEAVAGRLGVTLDVHQAANAAELERALAAIAGSKAQGLIVTPSPFAASSQNRLVAFAASERLPAVYFTEDFPAAGGLMSYGPSIAEAYERAAGYVDRILRTGAKPADLPVRQPERIELVVNRSTAKALGLAIPESILLRARVVE
jgi:putative ABC transport system substrate-binding protein